MKYLWGLLLLISLTALIFCVYLKFMLPDVGPAPDIKVEITPERVVRGEYLANHVMVCADCHSMRDFTRYSAPVTGLKYGGGGEEFTEEFGLPGNFYPSNLTPFNLKDWTDGEIFRAITSGVSNDGRALFPAMPYPLYNQADEEDIYAIIAYLRTLPSVDNTVNTSKAKFPVSLLMNTFPMKYEHKQKPDKDNTIEYGGYMATVAGCIECHTPMLKGEPVWEEAFSGGRQFMIPAGIITTSNLTPDIETGIGNWSEEMFINRFKAFDDSSYTPHQVDVNSDFNTVMPWTMYAGMNESDLKAIYTYLKTLEPQKRTVTVFAPKN